MIRFARALLFALPLALLLAACAAAAPAPTETPVPPPTASPTPAHTATSTPRPLPTNTPAPTVLLPITATLPPVTLPLPATVAPTVCAPRADWTGSHTILPGETLFGIALQYELGIRALQLGNCIEDANQILAGQALNVPSTGETPTPTLPPSATPAPTGTPSPTVFAADSSTLAAGECTFLRWEVAGFDAVLFNGTPVSGRGIREVCPTEMTRYTLLVLYPDGQQIPYLVLVDVRPA